MCVIITQSTKDAYIHCGGDEWCHVICAELIHQTQFINNNRILNLLLASFAAEGLQIPHSLKAQDQIINLTKLFLILPSNCVLLTPLAIPGKSKLHCSVCKELIKGRYVSCWYSQLIVFTVVIATVHSTHTQSVYPESIVQDGGLLLTIVYK